MEFLKAIFETFKTQKKQKHTKKTTPADDKDNEKDRVNQFQFGPRSSKLFYTMGVDQKECFRKKKINKQTTKTWNFT